jgi:hypothetical protein
MADEESERIAKRFMKVAHPKEAEVKAVFDEGPTKWPVRISLQKSRNWRGIDGHAVPLLAVRPREGGGF